MLGGPPLGVARLDLRVIMNVLPKAQDFELRYYSNLIRSLDFDNDY